jgi:hypothetical protein
LREQVYATSQLTCIPTGGLCLRRVREILTVYAISQVQSTLHFVTWMRRGLDREITVRFHFRPDLESGTKEYTPDGRWVPSAALAQSAGKIQVLSDRVERAMHRSRRSSWICSTMRRVCGKGAEGSGTTLGTVIVVHSSLTDARAVTRFGCLPKLFAGEGKQAQSACSLKREKAAYAIRAKDNGPHRDYA